MRLSEDEFAAVVAEAIESIPEGFEPYLEGVAVDVEDMPDRATCERMDMPDRATCERMDISDPRTLLGLYHGTPLDRRHVDAPYRWPDRIVIYRRNIERMCRSRKSMITQIRKTVLHEVGHHFGMTEEQLRELGYG